MSRKNRGNRKNKNVKQRQKKRKSKSRRNTGGNSKKARSFRGLRGNKIHNVPLGQTQVYKSNNTNRIVLSHREMVDTITSKHLTTQVESYVINPGAVAIFPWLSRVSAAYEKYTWRRLEFHWTPYINKTVDGMITFAPDYDVGDVNNTFGPQQFLSFDGAIRTTLNNACSLRISAKALKAREWYYVRGDGTGPSVSHDAVKLWVALNSMDVLLDAQIGDIWVEYTIELFQPMVENPRLQVQEFNTISVDDQGVDSLVQASTNLRTIFTKNDVDSLACKEPGHYMIDVDQHSDLTNLDCTANVFSTDNLDTAVGPVTLTDWDEGGITNSVDVMTPVSNAERLYGNATYLTEVPTESAPAVFTWDGILDAGLNVLDGVATWAITKLTSFAFNAMLAILLMKTKKKHLINGPLVEAGLLVRKIRLYKSGRKKVTYMPMRKFVYCVQQKINFGRSYVFEVKDKIYHLEFITKTVDGLLDLTTPRALMNVKALHTFMSDLKKEDVLASK